MRIRRPYACATWRDDTRHHVRDAQAMHACACAMRVWGSLGSRGEWIRPVTLPCSQGEAAPGRGRAVAALRPRAAWRQNHDCEGCARAPGRCVRPCEGRPRRQTRGRVCARQFRARTHADAGGHAGRLVGETRQK